MRDANHPHKLSQLDMGGAIKNSHDFEGQNLRVRDSVSVVQDFFTHYRVTYDNEMPTQVLYYLGTQPHISEVGVTGDTAGSLANKFFFLFDARTEQKYHVWYNVDGGGVDPSPVNSLPIEVAIQSNDDQIIVAEATSLYINDIAPRVFDARRIGSAIKITNKRFGQAPNTINGDTSFLISNTQGQQRLIEEVNITYNNSNPIWEGQELPGYKLNVFTGKFELGINPPDISVDFSPAVGGTPTIINVTLSLAGTEGSFVLPQDTTRFMIRSRQTAKLQFSYVAGQTNTNFLTIPKGANYSEEGLQVTSDTTVYIQSPSKPNIDVEITYWI